MFSNKTIIPDLCVVINITSVYFSLNNISIIIKNTKQSHFCSADLTCRMMTTRFLQVSSTCSSSVCEHRCAVLQRRLLA